MEKCDNVEGEEEGREEKRRLREIEVKKKQKKTQLFHFPACLNSALKIGNSGVP